MYFSIIKQIITSDINEFVPQDRSLMMDGVEASHLAPEACSTPRSVTHDTSDAFVSQIEAMGIRKGSPADSEESEADILERSIRLSSGMNQCNEDSAVEYKIQQLTHNIEPTTVFSGSIMHTAESPSQMNIDPAWLQSSTNDFPQSYHPDIQLVSPYSSASNNETQLPQNQAAHDGNLQNSTDGLCQNEDSKEIHVQPSAPTLQQIQSHPSVPLIDISRFQPPMTANPSKQSHLGQRPSASGSYITEATEQGRIIQTQKSVEPHIDNTQNPPQENMNISLSPITSPNTSLLLKPSIHWYYSNPGGSWNPFSYTDSAKLEKAYNETRAAGLEFVEMNPVCMNGISINIMNINHIKLNVIIRNT